ncbi:hypothetical protein CLOM_g1389 [Closterium sp. NIES-68]|nr:hypothetical protein CLOM_g1389 [Closterium sp. NIES-68]
MTSGLKVTVQNRKSDVSKPDVNVASRTSTFQAGHQRFKPDVNVSSRTSTFQAGRQRFKPEVNVQAGSQRSSRKSTFQAGSQRFKPVVNVSSRTPRLKVVRQLVKGRLPRPPPLPHGLQCNQPANQRTSQPANLATLWTLGAGGSTQ